MRISDWSSDVCSSDLASRPQLSARRAGFPPNPLLHSGIFWGYATFGSGGVALFHISVQAGRFDPATANRRGYLAMVELVSAYQHPINPPDRLEKLGTTNDGTLDRHSETELLIEMRGHWCEDHMYYS